MIACMRKSTSSFIRPDFLSDVAEINILDICHFSPFSPCEQSFHVSTAEDATTSEMSKVQKHQGFFFFAVFHQGKNGEIVKCEDKLK